MEPHKLRRWKTGYESGGAQFFTCARPGRSRGKGRRVPDKLVHEWVSGLPGTNTAIVSLLGRKSGQNGKSEFSFYSFYGGVDLSSERQGRPSFQEWLDRWHKERCIEVFEYPTYDLKPIPPETLVAVSIQIRNLLSIGRTVVLVDSGGEERTKKVCKCMGFTKDTTKLTQSPRDD